MVGFYSTLAHCHTIVYLLSRVDLGLGSRLDGLPRGPVAVCPMIGVGLGWEVWVCREKVKEVLVLPSKMP